ncbi:MAG: DUF4186 family protein [Chitinophagaceae bacterium]
MAFKKVQPDKPVSQLTPLDVTCTSTRCNDKLHCFKVNKRLEKKYGKTGICRDCQADLVDWERIRMNNLDDVDYTFTMLRHELIRHVFWHTDISTKAIGSALQKGRIVLKEKAIEELRKKVGGENNFREGYQTPKGGDDIIHYAQHATATCCRKCMEYWFKIPIGTALTEKQLDYCAELIIRYIGDRVKDLSDGGKN